MEENSSRGGAPAGDQPDEKPLTVKKEEPDPEVSCQIGVVALALMNFHSVLVFHIFLLKCGR